MCRQSSSNVQKVAINVQTIYSTLQRIERNTIHLKSIADSTLRQLRKAESVLLRGMQKVSACREGPSCFVFLQRKLDAVRPAKSSSFVESVDAGLDRVTGWMNRFIFYERPLAGPSSTHPAPVWRLSRA